MKNMIIRDCFEGLRAHNILNQLYTQTRLDIALGDMINKLPFSYQKYKGKQT